MNNKIQYTCKCDKEIKRIIKTLDKKRKIIRNSLKTIDQINRLKADLASAIDDVLIDSPDTKDYKKEFDIRFYQEKTGNKVSFQITISNLELRRDHDYK